MILKKMVDTCIFLSVSFCLKRGRNLKRNMVMKRHKKWWKTSCPRLCAREEKLPILQKTTLSGKNTLITSFLTMKCKVAISSSWLWRTHGPRRISQTKYILHLIHCCFITCHFCFILSLIKMNDHHYYKLSI